MDCEHAKNIPLFPAQDYITGQQFEVAHCGDCGFDITLPQPPPDKIGDYYPVSYYGKPSARRFPAIIEWLQLRLYQQRVNWVNRRFGKGKRGRVLDVGCGRGLLLNEFKRQGWEVAGTEFSETASSYAREVLGLPIQLGTLEKIHFPDQHFDAVTLWHVAEHIRDPNSLLAEINRILKPGGIVMIGVPNFGGWEARLCRDKWFHLDVPRHLTHYTRNSLEKALAAHGFGGFTTHDFAPEYDAFSFVQSILSRLGVQHNLLYNQLRRSEAKTFGDRKTSFGNYFFTWTLVWPLGFFSLFFTTIAAWMHKAGTMTILARKK